MGWDHLARARSLPAADWDSHGFVYLRLENLQDGGLFGVM